MRGIGNQRMRECFFTLKNDAAFIYGLSCPGVFTRETERRSVREGADLPDPDLDFPLVLKKKFFFYCN